jgi:Xaa-Pro aminopeptidase
MAITTFDAPAVLAAMRVEFAVVDKQFQALSERHRGLQQVIEGLETLLKIGMVPAEAQRQLAAQDRADVARARDTVVNVVAALRHIRRPLNAAEIQRVIEHGGVAYKRDTIYKALRRGEDSGLMFSENRRFGLTEWKKQE